MNNIPQDIHAPVPATCECYLIWFFFFKVSLQIEFIEESQHEIILDPRRVIPIMIGVFIGDRGRM